VIIFGGAVVGFLAWLFGLIADRISLIRLVLTVIMSMLGLTASFRHGLGDDHRGVRAAAW
jgi:hypothetical protein